MGAVMFMGCLIMEMRHAALAFMQVTKESEPAEVPKPGAQYSPCLMDNIVRGAFYAPIFWTLSFCVML